MHKHYFNSQHPLLMASMNGVSTLPLALACWEAGVFPSLMIPFRQEDFRTAMSPEDRRDAINQTLLEFKKITGNCDVIVGLMYSELDDVETMQLILDHQVSHVEFFSTADQTKQYNPMMEKYQKLYQLWFTKKLRNYSSIRFMERIRQLISSTPGTAIGLHGSDGAGGTNTELTTQDMFDQQRQLTPDAVIIPYGGVGTPEQVAYYLNAGAAAVAVGTLFAACQESPLSEATKHAMISASTNSVVRMPDTKQNMLPLGTLTDIVDSKNQSVANRDSSLYAGIRGDGTVGHIYAGHGIQHVNSIRTVRETVEYLTSHLI
jgi:NAD(P)H-dependent flavin oxidoreductase YrpB (nitropropane dioxygenase family)